MLSLRAGPSFIFWLSFLLSLRPTHTRSGPRVFFLARPMDTAVTGISRIVTGRNLLTMNMGLFGLIWSHRQRSLRKTQTYYSLETATFSLDFPRKRRINGFPRRLRA